MLPSSEDDLLFWLPQPPIPITPRARTAAMANAFPRIKIVLFILKNLLFIL
jgi:hypothetical protein